MYFETVSAAGLNVWGSRPVDVLIVYGNEAMLLKFPGELN